MDAVVTDPPWNRGKDYGTTDDARAEDAYLPWLAEVLRHCVRVSRGPVAVFLGRENGERLPTLLRRSTARPSPRCLARLHWQRSPGVLEDVAVLAGSSAGGLRRDLLCRAEVALADSPEPAETFGHPCPKPVAAVQGLLAVVLPTGGTVLDPFMGVGSTLLAARHLGCPAIGMELEERFCSSALHRLTGAP